MHCTCAFLQFLYCGKKASLSIGNVKPLGEMPEGTIVCNVEEVSVLAWCCRIRLGGLDHTCVCSQDPGGLGRAAHAAIWPRTQSCFTGNPRQSADAFINQL